MESLKLKMLGHACFLLDDGDARLVIDPYDDATGYPPLRVSADMLLMSHGHHDHNFAEGVTLSGKPEPFSYKTVDTFHDDAGGAQRGPNKVFIVQAGGFSVCHLGDLGHIPSQAQYAAIGKVDILLVPVGGHYTIDAKQAAAVVREINPDVVIPMHYCIEGHTRPITSVDPFLAEMRGWTILRDDLDGKDTFTAEKPLARCVCVLKMPG